MSNRTGGRYLYMLSYSGHTRRRYPNVPAQLRNVFDSSFLAAATKKDRSLNPLLNMVKGQKWDTIKSCYGPYFYNVRHRLSVRDGILLYDDRAVIPKQLRQTLVDTLHLTHPGQGGLLEAARYICTRTSTETS